jgi:hypothetical protein
VHALKAKEVHYGPYRKVASFLDRQLSPDQVTTLANHLDFDSMKKNPAVNKARISILYSIIKGTVLRDFQPSGFFY